MSTNLENSEVLAYQYLAEALFNIIPADIIKGIEEWNKEAGVLNKFDPVLERTMLAEELSEGLLATNIVDRLDAVCDYLFVRTGTCMKWVHSDKGVDEFLQVLSPTFLKFKTFLTLVSNELEILAPNTNKAKIIEDVLRIVLEANQQKLKNTEISAQGKVKKPKGFIPPEERIKDYLESIGVNTGSGKLNKHK